MTTPLTRVWRALIGALRLTLRGQTAAPSPLVPLRAWMTQTPPLVTVVLHAAEAAGFDRQTRIVVEGRRVGVAAVLETIAFHARTEYPALLAQAATHTLAALYATNINDVFLLGRCLEHLPAGEARTAAARLLAHLQAAPQADAPPTN